MSSIIYARPAAKALSKLPDAVRADIIAKLTRYAESGEGDVRRMVGSRDVGLRVGDYRASMRDDANGILVVAVGHRREIYR